MVMAGRLEALERAVGRRRIDGELLSCDSKRCNAKGSTSSVWLQVRAMVERDVVFVENAIKVKSDPK